MDWTVWNSLLWLNLLWEPTAPGVVSAIQYLLSGTHLREQYLKVLYWVFTSRLKTHCWDLAYNCRQTDSNDMTCVATASEVTIFWQDRKVNIVIIVIIKTASDDHGPASYAAMHCQYHAAVLFVVISFLRGLVICTESVLSTASSALFTHSHTNPSRTRQMSHDVARTPLYAWCVPLYWDLHQPKENMHTGPKDCTIFSLSHILCFVWDFSGGEGQDSNLNHHVTRGSSPSKSVSDVVHNLL